MREHGHVFAKDELEDILDSTIGKTLGDVDRNNVFYKTVKHPKITGIAGSVVEESVLGYPADSYQKPDLYVDGKDVEVKTTGLRRVKKSVNGELEAKEPMSVTAVSPKKIVYESFENSSFWHKLERLLLVYYLYDSEVTVPASEYAKFPIVGYDFFEFDSLDREKLKNDWEIVRSFINNLQLVHQDPTEHYPRISSELRSQLMLIDTAPKWPNPPRFRLKRSTVTTMVQKSFGKKFEQLEQEYNTYEELDEQLKQFTKQYKNKTIQELLQILNIPIKSNQIGDVSKSVTEQIVTRMFGAKSKKIGKIELFSEIGLIAKTITQTKQGTRTEDTKLFKVDFDEWLDEKINFEDSSLYSDFSERQFLFIIFQEQDKSEKLLTNKFLGFKRVIFSEEFIENQVKSIWGDVRSKFFSNSLREEVMLNKNGKPVINKNGTIKTSVNFPKSKDYDVFFRGTGRDSSDKTITIKGIDMYKQNVWIKGSVINEMLNSVDFL
ncbi:MutH/Sau3AI family endonuclease [Carnobacterium inhibens]|uniref:Restriction endonuclease n=1 Tax=Carnobacterium inhibens subsp. gilichinskyi TaxID=1266845 RepID=U5SBI2_9LACT|nr:MutH/Sau3AI family endonuclease [Carnobacterium inhibens]AGY82629.1 restriction endonuclease [Carnobacterium inhibens subsp. gilichinskyi]